MIRMIKDPKTGRFVKHEKPNLCIIEGCDRRVRGHGMCNMHLLRFQRYGDPHFRKRKANGEGPNYERNRRYKFIRDKNGKWVLEHRKIAETILGRPLTKDEIVHHIDGNPSNNSPDNLTILPRKIHAFKHPEVLENLKAGPSVRWGTNRD